MVTHLRVARVKTGLSLRAFAKTHGLSEVTLCRIERGNQYVPPSWRLKLADALNLNVNDLCDEKGWPQVFRETQKNIAVMDKGMHESF